MSRFVMYLSILKAIKTWRIYIIQKLTLIIFDYAVQQGNVCAEKMWL